LSAFIEDDGFIKYIVDRLTRLIDGNDGCRTGVFSGKADIFYKFLYCEMAISKCQKGRVLYIHLPAQLNYRDLWLNYPSIAKDNRRGLFLQY
jgi:hypothetical protein